MNFDELSHANEALSQHADPVVAAREVLAFAEAQLDLVKLASSFSVEDVVLIDLAQEYAPHARVFTLDTGRLHEETYEVMDKVRERYSLELEVYAPNTQAVESLVQLKGPRSFYKSVDDRKECCHVRKVEPLSRALDGAAGWGTGLRREQAVTRTALLPLEIDVGHGGIVKLNPLFLFSEEDTWGYVRAHNLPFNALHTQGFPSIGCAPCTRAVQPGEDLRAGRWWWESPSTKECGLHLSSSSRASVGATQ